MFFFSTSWWQPDCLLRRKWFLLLEVVLRTKGGASSPVLTYTEMKRESPLQARQKDRSGVFAVSDATPGEGSREPEESSGAEAAEFAEDDDADEAPDSTSAGVRREPAASALPSKAGPPPQ